MPKRRRSPTSSSSSSGKRRKKKESKRRKRKSSSSTSRSGRSKKSRDKKDKKDTKESKTSKRKSEKRGKSEKHRKRSKSAKKAKSRSRSRSPKKTAAKDNKAKSRSRSRSPKKTASKDNKAPTSQPAEAKAVKKDVPDWLADLFPQGGGSSAPLVAQAPAVRTEQVEIPLSMIGILTAGNEAVVRNIASSSGAVVQLRQDMSHFGYCLCFITGTADKVSQAKEMLHQQVGLSGNLVTRELDTSADHVSAHNALEMAMSEMHKRKTQLSASVVMPTSADGRVKIRIGPGQIALVSMAEQLIRKQLANVELEILHKSGRPVPIEMKIAKLCQFFEQGGCILGARCQCCHGPDELALAKKARVLQNPGAEIARGLDSADVPRWPPLPGDIRALAPIVDGQEVGVDALDVDRGVQMKSETSGLI